MRRFVFIWVLPANGAAVAQTSLLTSPKEEN
jgi:hypothetical protein